MTTTPRPRKLTQSLFFELPDGVYLVSNVGDSPSKPSFAETVGSADQRPEQWLRIRAARADQRLYHVFNSKDDFDKGIQGLHRQGR